MDGKLKFSSILVIVFMVSLFVTPISASEVPTNLTSLNNEELSEIRGMGQNFSIEQINSNDFQFKYSGNKGNAFKHASGVMNVTNVSGDGNTIKNIVDLKINIYNIEEVESLDLSDIKNVIDIKD